MKALLNIIIPSSSTGDLEGAGDLGLAESVSSAVQADPGLGPQVAAGVQALQELTLVDHPDGLAGMSLEEGTEVVERVLADHPLLIVGILRFLYPAYYQHPRVLEGIGEPPRPPFPEGFEVEPTDPELLDKLRSRLG